MSSNKTEGQDESPGNSSWKKRKISPRNAVLYDTLNKQQKIKINKNSNNKKTNLKENELN